MGVCPFGPIVASITIHSALFEEINGLHLVAPEIRFGLQGEAASCYYASVAAALGETHHRVVTVDSGNLLQLATPGAASDIPL